MPVTQVAPPGPAAKNAAPVAAAVISPARNEAAATAAAHAAAPASTPLSLDVGESIPGIDPLLLSCTRISTFSGEQGLTSATGFFLAREGRLFLVTSRHVFSDELTQHHPDRITIEIHVDREDMAAASSFSIPLYRDRLSLWHQAMDSGGEIDVALIEVDRSLLPSEAVYSAFTPDHITGHEGLVAVGAPLLVIGFPLGFHDALHHMPVVRRASLASSFGLRFQGMGYFLTDARTHRGTSGAPVVIRLPAATGGVSCRLLGVHSSRFDMPTRDPVEDEALGLNCAWYSDVLLTLSET